MLKFFWNGIKDNGGKLQRCFYSDGMLTNYPEGTITIYARDYAPFTAGVRDSFRVENNSEYISDYVESDLIRVTPSHPLYSAVLSALNATQDHQAKRRAKLAA